MWQFSVPSCLRVSVLRFRRSFADSPGHLRQIPRRCAPRDDERVELLAHPHKAVAVLRASVPPCRGSGSAQVPGNRARSSRLPRRREATGTARKIVRLREDWRARLSGLGRRSPNALRLLDLLFQDPAVTAKSTEALLEISQPAASALVNSLAGAGVLKETTGRRKNRVFVFESYLRLFRERAVRG